jgi:hypothetical protein
MNDSNWKKLIDLGRLLLTGTASELTEIHAANAISKRYCKALSGATLSSVAFDNIDRSASSDSIRVWAAEEERAKRERMLHSVVRSAGRQMFLCSKNSSKSTLIAG